MAQPLGDISGFSEDENGLGRPRPRPRRGASVRSATSSGPERPRRSSVHSSNFISNELPPIAPSPVSYTETQAAESATARSLANLIPPIVEAPQITPIPQVSQVSQAPQNLNEARYSISNHSQIENRRASVISGDHNSSSSPAESQFVRRTAEPAERGTQEKPPMLKRQERTPGIRMVRPGSAGSTSQGSLQKPDMDALIVGGRPARKLGTIEVASLIINKMIGSGIVTGPAKVLLYTGRKDYALLLWGLGFLYTLVSVVIFVEFGYKFRVTGGELVYLDELFKKPKLLFVTIFAGQFILFWNTATNCSQAARQIIACADKSLDTNNVYDGQDTRLIAFIAIVISSFVCLLHYFSTAAGRVTNVAFAVFKVVMLLILLGRGAWFSETFKQGGYWKAQPNPIEWKSFTYATFIVLFAFQGWENASFVAGEVDIAKTRALRNGYYIAVLLVGFLYLFVNVAFLTAFDFIVGGTPDGIAAILSSGRVPIEVLASDGYAARYWGSTPDAVRAWTVLLTLSTLGNILAVTYTCGRGLLLHWICTCILILISVGIPNSKGTQLPGSLQAYSHAAVALAVTVAFCFFTAPLVDGQETYQWSWLKFKRVSWPIITVSILMNLAMICLPIGSAVPDSSVPGWVFAATCFLAVISSILYYFILFPVEDYMEPSNKWKKWSLLRLAGVSWSIRLVEEDIYNERWERFQRTSRHFEGSTSKVGYQDEQIKQFGERKMVYYTLDPVMIGNQAHQPSTTRRLVFWFFGGSFNNKTYKSPWTEWALKKPNFQGAKFLAIFRQKESVPPGLSMQDVQ
ncbi:hypothetical protein TWF106_005115 [Orbilia oligospora]|uniref:Uncharacterized protein n=1 Tax=Orbilia oligospora TaxID=2813651 RepID=A0A7C8QS10_ORBOL|nr:hypothetical protein TWF679_005930 [Orbilia oligospora]KAF3223342.1 hypothetical protein TWF106_005115 [Orbilia oligospora]